MYSAPPSELSGNQVYAELESSTQPVQPQELYTAHGAK
jgi:hypothetical protein